MEVSSGETVYGVCALPRCKFMHCVMIRLNSLSKVSLHKQKPLSQRHVFLRLQLCKFYEPELASRLCLLRPSFLRSLTYTHRVRKDDARSQRAQGGKETQDSPRSSNSVKELDAPKSENEGKLPGSSRTDSLLLDRRTSNKEQRKADWAILKEMSKYLWPKVCFHSQIALSRKC